VKSLTIFFILFSKYAYLLFHTSVIPYQVNQGVAPALWDWPVLFFILVIIPNRTYRRRVDQQSTVLRWRNGSNNMKGRKTEHEYDGDPRRGMTRRKQVVIARLRTRYTKSTHEPRMNGITDPQCPFCETGDLQSTTSYGNAQKLNRPKER
jgi:hypothetical protein